MAAAGGWEFPVVQNGYEIYIARIGDMYDDEIRDVLNEVNKNFTQVESVLYLRAYDTGVQKELVEDDLGLDWNPVNMPWLLVLEDHPDEVEEGDQAIVFRLGKLDVDQIEEVTDKLVAASREADALRQLTWGQRKEEFRDKIPVLKETAKMVISVVGVV